MISIKPYGHQVDDDCDSSVTEVQWSGSDEIGAVTVYETKRPNHANCCYGTISDYR